MSLEAERLARAAESAGDTGQWAEAARLYDRLLASRTEDVALLLRLGFAQGEAGQPEAAEASYVRALALSPGEPGVLLALGRLALAAGRKAEALAFHRSAHARDPGDIRVAQAVRRLEAEVPAGLTPQLSGRLVLARRALARGDRAGAGEHYRAVLAAVPALAELRQLLAACISAQTAPRPDGAQALEIALDDAARPWLVVADAAGLPQMPPALRESGPIGLAVLLDAYMGPDCAGALAGLAEDFPDREAAGAALLREAGLRRLAPAGEAGMDEAAALLPTLSPPQPGVAEAAARARAEARGYFSAEAAWFRYLLRRAVLDGQPLPPADTLPLALLRFEPDLVVALAHPRDTRLLLGLPAVAQDGALFYRIVDACLRQIDPALGVPVARMGEAFFGRRGEPFKSLEFSLKAGLLLEGVPGHGRAAALDSYGRIVAEATEPGLLLEGVKRALSLLPEPLPEDARLPGWMAARDTALLGATLSLVLQQAGGGGDPLQRRAIQVLTRAMAGQGQAMLMLPAQALESPALLGHMLRHSLEGQPQAAALAPRIRQIAAFASGFEDVTATSQHLTDLLDAGDDAGIAAIGAYITHRYGGGFPRGEGQRITTILGSGNVGDTLLYMAGFAAFARASGQPVHVLHRAGRGALAEFFHATPGLSFEAIANELPVPPQLALNRLAAGNVSLFYETPWFHHHDAPRLADRRLERNFLWRKLIAVLLSGAGLLPPRIEVACPPMGPPPAWNAAARQRFASLGLPRGRTVFLSPLANTLFSLTPSRFSHFRAVWREAITLFRQAGFAVVMNGTNNNEAEALFADMGVPELNLDLRELPAFVAECGYFAGVRSGLCDLLALCGLDGVQARNIYMRGAEHCTGLADFGMSEVVADFNAHAPRDLAESLFADWLRG